MDITVSDNPERSRYEAFIDGKLAGFAAYRATPDRIVFTHTEIEPAFEGKGVGSVLAQQALDDVRTKGRPITPRCPFIADFIDKHPEYQDLVR
jgi:predicted GNAT family acetyltransferase